MKLNRAKIARVVAVAALAAVAVVAAAVTVVTAAAVVAAIANPAGNLPNAPINARALAGTNRHWLVFANALTRRCCWTFLIFQGNFPGFGFKSRFGVITSAQSLRRKKLSRSL